jgi:hypothetical protein
LVRIAKVRGIKVGAGAEGPLTRAGDHAIRTSSSRLIRFQADRSEAPELIAG